MEKALARELEAVGRADTWQGVAALKLAAGLDNSRDEPVSGLVALSKAFRAAWDRAFEGARPADELAARRELRWKGTERG